MSSRANCRGITPSRKVSRSLAVRSCGVILADCSGCGATATGGLGASGLTFVFCPDDAAENATMARMIDAVTVNPKNESRRSQARSAFMGSVSFRDPGDAASGGWRAVFPRTTGATFVLLSIVFFAELLFGKRRVPARLRIPIFLTQRCQGPVWLNVGTSDKKRIHGRNGRHIRSVKRGIGDGSDPERITKPRNRRFLAVRDAEGGDPVFMGSNNGTYRGPQAAPKADGNEQVLRTKQIHFLLQVSGRSRRSIGVIPQGNQPIGEEVGEGCRKIDPDHHDAPGAIEAFGQPDHLVGIELRAQGLQIVRLHLEAVLDVTRDAPALACCRLHQRVRGETADEVGAQIGGEVGIALVTEHLNATDNGGLVDAVAFGKRARREKVVFLRVLDDAADEPVSTAIQIRLGLFEAALESGHPGLAFGSLAVIL